MPRDISEILQAIVQQNVAIPILVSNVVPFQHNGEQCYRVHFPSNLESSGEDSYVVSNSCILLYLANRSSQHPSSSDFNLASADWFWVLNAGSDTPFVEVERIVAWEKTPAGYVGLLSKELKGTILQTPPPMRGGVYKHFNDLSPKELEALEKKKHDKTWDQHMADAEKTRRT